MTKRDIFINEVNALIKKYGEDVFSEDAMTYFNVMSTESEEKKKFTENGKLVLQYMRDNEKDYDNLFQAKAMGEGMGISSRTVSGAMRKLKDNGYVESLGGKPATYAITELGRTVDFE